MRKCQKGFSLVELIIVVTVLMIVMSAVSILAFQMSTAAANQRRRQAQHAAEGQIRMALLNIVRDVRMSSERDIAAEDPIPAPLETYIPLVLNAYTRDRTPVIITYTLNLIPDPGSVDAYDASQFLITRNVSYVAGGDVPIGDGADEWPNPFVPITVRNFTVIEYEPEIDGVTITDLGRFNLEIEIWIPLMPGDTIPICECDPAPPNPCNNLWEGGVQFRRETLNSSVSFHRRLQ